MFGSLRPVELIVIVVVAILLFGGKRIADVGKGLGQGIRNFKSGLKDGEAAADDAKNTGADSAKKNDQNGGTPPAA